MTPRKMVRYVSWAFFGLLMAVPFTSYAASSGDAKPFKAEQLDQMLAPIALYPDALLAQVLMASTYPLEIVEADRWAKKNVQLTGATLNDAVDNMDWDPSVKALVPFPQVLSMMSEQLDWTQKLGDAFLAQQSDVMDTVQKLRAKARAQDNLKTTGEQKVIVEEKIIRIEPAMPEVVYVPVYDPVVVYGPWWYPAYPPYYWGPPVIGRGLAFAAGVAVGVAWSHGWGYWGWGDHTINVNVNRNINVHNLKQTDIHTSKWEHDPAHRKGVAYRDEGSRQKYGQQLSGSPDARRDYRGYSQAASKGGQQSGQRDQSLQAQTGRGQDSGVDRFGERGASRGEAAGRSGEFGGGGWEQYRGSAFDGMGYGNMAREHADRGEMSFQGGRFGGGGHGGFHGRR